MADKTNLELAVESFKRLCEFTELSAVRMAELQEWAFYHCDKCDDDFSACRAHLNTLNGIERAFVKEYATYRFWMSIA